jgi:hypothetical protein
MAEGNAPSRALEQAGWRAFTAKWPPNLVATNVVASQRMTIGTELFISERTFQK